MLLRLGRVLFKQQFGVHQGLVEDVALSLSRVEFVGVNGVRRAPERCSGDDQVFPNLDGVLIVNHVLSVKHTNRMRGQRDRLHFVGNFRSQFSLAVLESFFGQEVGAAGREQKRAGKQQQGGILALPSDVQVAFAPATVEHTQQADQFDGQFNRAGNFIFRHIQIPMTDQDHDEQDRAAAHRQTCHRVFLVVARHVSASVP